MTEIDDHWLLFDEVCKYLGIGKDTACKQIDKHEIPLIEWDACEN